MKVQPPMFRTATRFASLTLGAAATVTLIAGCATTGEPAPTDVSTSRDSSIRGTNYCVQNNSSVRMRVTWRGFPSAIDIPPAGTQCNSGWELGSKNDIFAKLEYEPKTSPGSWQVLTLMGDNQFLGAPAAGAWFNDSGKDFGACGLFSVGDSQWMQTDTYYATLTRIEDTDANKEFVLNFTNPTGPASVLDVTSCVDHYGYPV